MRVRIISVILLSAFVSMFFCLASARAGIHVLRVVEEGGTIDTGNLATSGTAFGTDAYVSGSTYQIAKVNDGVLGHGHGWMGDEVDATLGIAFVGISWGTTLTEISGFAFGRDSTQTYLDDRALGEFTFQYTTVNNPDEETPNSDWTTIGTLDYKWFDPAYWKPPCTIMSARHRFAFNSVQATGVRLVVPYAMDNDPQQYASHIEELEVYNTTFSPRGPILTGSLELVQEGGTFDTGNLAAYSAGAVAFSTGEFVKAGYYSYQTSEVNDGDYGNDTAWIAAQECHRDPSFIGIDFGGSKTISSIAFGRDNDLTDGYNPVDRFIGTYTLEYTTVADPDEDTDDQYWTEIGTINYNYNVDGSVDDWENPTQRHRFDFDAVTATGIRLWVPATVGTVPPEDNSVSTKAGTCIDEIEVYASHYVAAVPEPSSIVMLLAGLVSLFCFCRKSDWI